MLQLQQQNNIKYAIFVKSVERQHLLEVVLRRCSNSDEF